MGQDMSCTGSKSEAISPERRALEEVHDRLVKIVKDQEGDEIKVTRNKFNDLIGFIKGTLNGPPAIKRSHVHPNGVQILTNRSSNASTKFVDRLQHTIAQKHNVKATIIETLEEVDKEKIFVVVCNKTQSGSPEKAVAKSMEEIKRELYGRVILIVLHVGRAEKLPLTPSKKQLSGTDFGKLGLIVDMGFENDEIYSCTTKESAFDEIKKFISSFEGTKIDSDTQTIVKDRTKVDGQSKSLQDSYNCKKVRESMKTKTFIVDPSKSNASECFMKEFGREIFEKFGIVVDQKQVDDAKDLAPDSTLLVVCNATSRIESDIEKCLHPALEKLYSRKILIVLHVVRKGQEPSQSTTQKLNAEKYESFDLIIDFAFTKEDGLYECTLNTKAFAELENVFSKISTTETKEDESMDETGDTGYRETS